MEVVKINLENYRNFVLLELDFSPHGSIVTGKNGSGKTNLLESIAYCAFGKSVMGNTDQELIRFNEHFFRISGDYLLNKKELKINCAVNKNQKKINVNSLKLDKLSDLFRYIKVVYFSPSDIDIIAGPPSNRRYFLDQAISQYDILYLNDLKNFNRILKQRNQLLKNEYSKNEKRSWDHEYAKAATEVINKRIQYLADIDSKLVTLYAMISGSTEELYNRYKHSFNCTDIGTYTNDLLTYLDENELREKDQQRTLAGPHLDDLDFYINGKIARKFASQGQKRSLSIVARLVQADMIVQKTGEHPILMFDDVLAELDLGRTNRILELLKPRHQIFIATPKNDPIYNQFELSEIKMADIQ